MERQATLPITLTQRPATLIEQAEWLRIHRAEDTAVVMVTHEGETRITYGQFFARAEAYAAVLLEAGIRPGDLVALILQHGESVLYGFWGALLMGAVPSIFPFLSDKLDPARYFDSARQLIDHSGVKAVITYRELEADLRHHLQGVEAVLMTTEALTQSTRTVGARHASPLQNHLFLNIQSDDTAFLQHSSGSTGLQKGVMLTHRALLNQVASYSAAIRLAPDDVVVSWLPLYHDMGLIAGFLMPILQGVKLVLMSPFQWVRDPKMLLWALHHHRGTLCWLPNFAYNFLATRVRDADLDGLDLSAVRALVNCSEPVYAESHAAFLARYAPYGFRESALTVCYAMAENTFAVTQAGIDAPLKLDVIDRRALMDERRAVPAAGDAPSMTLVSNGRPIPNCDVRVVDEARQPLPQRHVGEIALRSDSMLAGYYRRPDATAAVLADGWYFTGDMGYLADGELYITGRKKDLIIVGGKNVYPQDIENLLNNISGLHPGRATAFGVLNPKLGTEDVAIVAELEADVLEDVQARAAVQREIRARVAQNTDVTARYVQLVPPKWLIKTSSGKVARAANRDKFLCEVLGQTD
ncbi:MAG: AMP-binding protein [bacterium]|nr:AMP-binding protein [bacterium]